MAITFYAATGTYGCFSNFSIHPFKLDGHLWLTAEHYFQAQKFPGTPHADKIRQASWPRQAANWGRQKSQPLRPDWEEVKEDVMRRAILAKFTAHKGIRDVLLATGDEEIVETAPDDYFWGGGKKGTGKNRLGHILMDVREQLRLAFPAEPEAPQPADRALIENKEV